MKNNKDHEYQYKILAQCYSKSELAYKEVEELVINGAPWRGHPDGKSYLYFNIAVPAIKFRVTDRTDEPSIFFQGCGGVTDGYGE